MNQMIDVLASAATGLALWALLPRGVVLTRSVRHHQPSGARALDTWEVRNESPLPVKITRVRVIRPEGTTELSGTDNRPDLSVSLSYDDEVQDISRTDRRRPWRGLPVLPGDTLTAVVSVNSTLCIRYRRAGWLGVLERREVQINGVA